MKAHVFSWKKSVLEINDFTGMKTRDIRDMRIYMLKKNAIFGKSVVQRGQGSLSNEAQSARLEQSANSTVTGLGIKLQ